MSSMKELSLTFEDCAEDSPRFRASLQLMADEVEKVQTWMEGVTKTLQLFIDVLSKYGETSSSLAGKVTSSSPVNELVDSEAGNGALRTFSDSLMCVSSFQAKLVDDLDDYLLAPLVQFIREDIKQMKDQRRIYERILEKYEFTLSKYAALSKTREISSLREDAFQLYDLRKSYVRASMDYTLNAIKFKFNFDKLLMSKYSDAMDSIKDFYMNSAEIYRGLDSRLVQLKQNLTNQTSFRQQRLDTLEFERSNAEERFISDTKPTMFIPASSSVPTISSSLVEKQGYLFKKVIPKSAMMAPYWTRRWFYIMDGKFGFQVVSKSRGQIASFPASNILLYEIRADDKQDRRFTFEIFSIKRSYVLQAETDEEMASWVSIFERAKSSVIARGMNIENEINIDSKLNDEDEWTIEKKSLLTKMSSFVDQSLPVDSKQEPTLEYSESAFELKNDEMHNLCNLPQNEFYMESFSATLIGDKQSLGRVYLTQNKLCFYANCLDETINLQLLLSDVKSVSMENLDEGYVRSGTEEYVFKIHGGDENKFKVTLDLLIANVRSTVPESAQDIFDQLHESFKQISDTKALKDIPKVEITTVTKAPLVSLSPKYAAKTSTHEAWPDTLPVPTSEVICGCDDHLERREHVLIFETSAYELYNHMFTSDFFKKVHESYGDWDFEMTTWGGEPMQRDVSWMLKVNNPMVKAKETNCNEVQTILKRQDHLLYVVESASRTVNLPYGDAFLVCSRYCITFVSTSSCKLVITIGVKWLKNPLVKSIIKVNAMKGIADFMQAIANQLRTDFKDSTPKSDPNAEKAFLVPELASAKHEIAVIPRQGLVPLMLFVSLLLNLFAAFTFFTASSINLADPSSISANQFSSNSTIYLGTEHRDLLRKQEFESYLVHSTAFNWLARKSRTRSIIHGDIIGKSRKLKSDVTDLIDSVNFLETEVLENEYVIWMSDQISACTRAIKNDLRKQEVELACRNLKYDLARFLEWKSKSLPK